MVPVHKLGLRLVGTKNLSKIEMPTKILYRESPGWRFLKKIAVTGTFPTIRVVWFGQRSE